MAKGVAVDAGPPSCLARMSPQQCEACESTVQYGMALEWRD
jgi:hypothetical protein